MRVHERVGAGCVSVSEKDSVVLRGVRKRRETGRVRLRLLLKGKSQKSVCAKKREV